MELFNYDDSDIKSIITYAKKLEHKTFREIVEAYEHSDIKIYHNPKDTNFIGDLTKADVVSYINSEKAKGQLGGLIEQCYFGYKPNSKQEADFPKVGLELKQTCIDKKKSGGFRAGERLSITNIDFSKPVEEDFYKSHVWAKLQQILLVHYLRDKTIERLDNEITHVNLFSPSPEDLEIIMEDYRKINQKIKEGKAHEISEGDTMYLGACTKGATAESSYTSQYYNPDVKAKKRNYCLKQSYMNHVLNKYVLNNKVPFKSIIKNPDDLKHITFENYALSLLNKHIGKSDKQLCEEFNIQFSKNKRFWSTLTFRMLGVSSNQAEEFEKANIVVKTIRVEENDTINENMSFPTFKFKDLAKSTWEDSFEYDYFSSSKFLLVVFKKEKGTYKLKKALFWNIPESIIENDFKNTWIKTKQTIISGVKFRVIPFGKSERVENNLPEKTTDCVVHVRPHANRSAYKLKNGFIKGNIFKDGDELPNGEWMTKQCFWLNNTYIEEIVGLKK